MKFKGIKTAAVAAVTMVAATSAKANVIDWTQWTTANTSATAGSASGTMGTTNVSYSGEVDNLMIGYPSWGPVGTFNGGTVSNAPLPNDGIIQLSTGGVLDSITFSAPVIDPVIAIWSLGSSGSPATFIFPQAEPYVIQSGGPSNEYGGSSLFTISPGILGGSEGNGTIQFLGTYSSLYFVTTPENWYGFTVGSGAVPEPATWAMMLLGFAGIGFMMRGSRRKQSATAVA